MKVLAAMSGGVDSAVAAARAVEAGHEVSAVYLALHNNLASTEMLDPTQRQAGCGNPQDAADAAANSEKIGIPFEQWDYAAEFSQIVIADFLAQYEAGYTPNPCIRCNQTVKFAVLFDYARIRGFDAVLTGHYARTIAPQAADGRADAAVPTQLWRGQAFEKDQSYVLAGLSQEMLAFSMFPLGDMPDKDAVRAEAAARGLAVANKPDSFDICFIPDGDTQGFLRTRLGERPGLVVDETGQTVGEHRGAYAYTIGQRKGLGLGRPAADGRPRYVIDVNVKENIVTVGPKELLQTRKIWADQPLWHATDIPCVDWIPAQVQVRAHGRPLAAQVRIADGRLQVELNEKLGALARGQSVVVYRDDRVLGHGVISKTE
ncbi:MAG: tRNA 2-thiouridine(34) synthase MnmA [Trueperella sp.]|nr:tRNA 2-thiouridine(34) synthase MnmA [Trueperella sp.]